MLLRVRSEPKLSSEMHVLSVSAVQAPERVQDPDTQDNIKGWRGTLPELLVVQGNSPFYSSWFCYPGEAEAS